MHNQPQNPWNQQNPWGQQQQQNQYPQQYSQPYNQAGYGWGASVPEVRTESSEERLTFIKKVYALFTGSVVLSAIGALVALNVGAPVDWHGVPVPPLVAMVGGSPLIAFIATIGLVFGASAVRKKPGVNVVALFGMAFLLGIIFAPSLFVAQLSAGMGDTLSANPIRDAFILAVLMFGGLTGYVAVSKKDFSYLGSALAMGVWVILGAILLNLFFQSSVFSLAIASVGLILFGGYVLYDTSRILKAEDRDAVGGAMTIYLDFLNIFLYLLRILSSRR